MATLAYVYIPVLGAAGSSKFGPLSWFSRPNATFMLALRPPEVRRDVAENLKRQCLSFPMT